MEHSDSETESLRVEQGKPAEDEGSDDRAATSMSLGSMIRGPIGREGAEEEDDTGSDSAADREKTKRREP